MQAALLSPPELSRTTIEDGEEYIVRPFVWDIETADRYKDMFFGVGKKFAILSDDIPRTLDGFLGFVMTPGSVWFEVVRATSDEHIGFVYVTDLVRSRAENRYISATWHGLAWDSKIITRTKVARDAVRAIFKMFRLHRLMAVVPLIFGRTISAAKKIGFRQEGVMQSCRRYNGQWVGVLLMSITEEDLDGQQRTVVCHHCHGSGIEPERRYDG